MVIVLFLIHCSSVQLTIHDGRIEQKQEVWSRVVNFIRLLSIRAQSRVKFSMYGIFVGILILTQLEGFDCSRFLVLRRLLSSWTVYYK